jgi:hypothetical protein
MDRTTRPMARLSILASDRCSWMVVASLAGSVDPFECWSGCAM